MHYEGAQGDGGTPQDPTTVNVISRFYPRLTDQRYLMDEAPENTRWTRLRQLAEDQSDKRPILTSEYAHAMGNAVGNLAEYWREIYSQPRLIGGFIWDWSDQALSQTRADGQCVMAYGGDFGDRPNSGTFCLNGILLADRTRTPKYWEVKKVYQPVSIELVSASQQQVEIQFTNRHHFLDLQRYDVSWSLTTDGQVRRSATLSAIQLAAGQQTTVKIALPSELESEAGGERLLHVSIRTRTEFAAMPPGHEIAWEQFVLPSQGGGRPVVATASLPPVRMSQTDDEILIRGRDFEVTLSRSTACLSSLRYGERELLIGSTQEPKGPVLQAYRAPTDNDRGFGRWLAREWQRAGLDELRPTVESIDVRQPVANLVRIETVVRYAMSAGDITHRLVWRIRGDGSIDLNSRFVPHGRLPPLPRIGITMRLNDAYQDFTWHGRGPHENYNDRQQSAAIGLWTSKVSEQCVAYLRPQETGNKEDVQYLALTDEQGTGLLVVAEATSISVSALPYTAAQLASASHAYELPPSTGVVLSLDAGQCGLGNSSCGPGVLARFSLPAREYALHVSLRPLKSNRPREIAQAAKSRYD